jgi:hypothetical protein
MTFFVRWPGKIEKQGGKVLISFFCRVHLYKVNPCRCLSFFVVSCLFEAMLMVKVNPGFHKLFGINYMFVSGVYSSYLYGSRSPFIFFNLYMLFRSFLWSISSLKYLI